MTSKNLRAFRFCKHAQRFNSLVERSARLLALDFRLGLADPDGTLQTCGLLPRFRLAGNRRLPWASLLRVMLVHLDSLSRQLCDSGQRLASLNSSHLHQALCPTHSLRWLTLLQRSGDSLPRFPQQWCHLDWVFCSRASHESESRPAICKWAFEQLQN